MKMKNTVRLTQLQIRNLLSSVLICLIMFSACQQDSPSDSNQGSEPAKSMEELTISEEFNYNTTQSFEIKLTLQSIEGNALTGVKVDVYDENNEQGGNALASGVSDDNGQLTIDVTAPSYLDSISIRPQYVGLLSEAFVAVDGNDIELNIGGPNESVIEPETENATSSLSTKVTSISSDWFNALGKWDRRGVPDYLEKKRDNIDKEFLNDINASLPERQNLSKTNSEYLTENDINTRLDQDAEVWVTFVHEGTSWRNALGFYTYDLNNPPSSPENIDSLYMVFPNASYHNSGGGLKSGDKVKIGTFKTGTGIGWFLVPSGWSSWLRTVRKNNSIKWSDKRFNDYGSHTNVQHIVALKDNSRELVLLGFEDKSKPNSDEDYNDCIFYVSANPYAAINVDDIQSIKTKKDTDNDGVDDHSDQYPEDSERAFNRYSPAKDVFGTLAYEDLWPSKGDYDFNDLVVDYNHQLVLNAKNKVVEVKSTFKTRAIGGAFENGFGYQFMLNPNQVKSVTGTHLTEGIITTNANGTESGQSKAVIIVYDNAFAHMKPVSGYTVNAEKGSPYVEPFVAEVKVEFNNPVSSNSLGRTPYNPFIISNKRRGVEIHLSGERPTDLCDKALFGKNDDNTNPGRGFYFKTKKYHPWAIHTPEKFDYPAEKQDIVRAYNFLQRWAESTGRLYSDWFKKKQSYRNDKNIY